MIRKRFDDEMTGLLEEFRWWDKEIDEINTLIPLFSDPDTEKVNKGSEST